MLIRDLFRLSFHNLLLHKVRSTLTSLGVIFGVGSVIAMLSISEGAKQTALAQIEAMGIDKIIVFAEKPPPTSRESSDQGSVSESYGLTERDFGHINKMDNIDRITPLRNARKRILRGLRPLDLKLVGVGQSFLEDSASTLVRGRWFAPADFKNATNVCVIGSEVKRKMFTLGKTNIVGGTLRVEGQVYRIVGIIENDIGTQYPGIGSPNDLICIPMVTSNALFGNYAITREGRSTQISIIDYDLFIVRVLDIMHIDDTSKRIISYLQKAHSENKDWGLLVPLDLLKQKEQTQNIFTIVMGSIAGISLIVGGIGIMNIMLASVYERRKEIGTRRALGAQKLDILFQFLIETVFLTSLGGVLGIMLGLGIASLITYYTGMPTVYLWWSVVLSLLISSLVGVVFGTYPAWKAAQQNPIDVLRSE